MTASQRARLIGINASLRMRGVLLSLSTSDEVFTALVDDIAPESSEYSLSSETRAGSIVSILKSDLGAVTVGIGDLFTNAESGARYRVISIGPRVSDILAGFVCESVA